MTPDQFEKELDQAFSRFFIIFNSHEALRHFVAVKHDEFDEVALDMARKNLEKIRAQYGDLRSAKLIDMLPLITPGCVAQFPVLRNRQWLIGSVSAFEVYFKDAIVLVLRHKPDLIDEKHSKAEAPLHKQMKDLDYFYKKLDFLKEKLRIEFDNKEFTRDQLLEIQAKRNAFVHHDGIVTERYPKRFQELTGCKEGDGLDMSDEYRRDSGRCLAHAAVHLHMSLLKKFAKG